MHNLKPTASTAAHHHLVLLATRSWHSCRREAEASIGAVQAVADTVAALHVPHTRRTTAETATQYMLGDLDSEPLTAHAHARQRQESQALARASIDTTASEEEPSGPFAHGPVGLHRHALAGLICAQGQPSRAFDRGHESDRMSKHPLPEVKYSELEGTVTAAEDEEMLGRAAVALAAGNSPNNQSYESVNQHQQSTLGTRQSPAGVSPDGISILVMAGSNDQQPGGTLSSQADPGPQSHADTASAWHVISGGRTDGRTALGYGGEEGLDASRGRAGGQSMTHPAARSPLQSIHEDHEMGHRSTRASSTGSSAIFLVLCLCNANGLGVTVMICQSLHAGLHCLLTHHTVMYII